MPEEKKNPKVLLVEDDKFLVRMYEARLSAEGFKVETALNGDECLEKASSSNPDIILLDLMLPLLDGFAVLQRLKADEKIKKIPVIVFSNRSQQDDILKAKELGAEDFLVKVSTPPEEVIRKINNILHKSASVAHSPNKFYLEIDWNTSEAKRMVEVLGIPVEYRAGKCAKEMYLEAMPEYSHDEPWIIGRFVPKKKNP